MCDKEVVSSFGWCAIRSVAAVRVELCVLFFLSNRVCRRRSLSETFACDT